MKNQTVIKVEFDTEHENDSVVKINFYKSGSVVIQGPRCILFSDLYFELIKNKLDYIDSDDNNNTIVENQDFEEETTPKSLLFNNSFDNNTTANEHEINKNSTPNKKGCDTPDLPKPYPRERITQHNKTIVTRFSEIHSILSVMDDTLKTFSTKLAQLNEVCSKMTDSINNLISNKSHKEGIITQLNLIENKAKHYNSSLDSLHTKSNVLDTQIKEQNESIRNMSTQLINIQEHIKQLEERSRDDKHDYQHDNVTPQQHDAVPQKTKYTRRTSTKWYM